ncbi:thiamine pyrophosphate-dependent enzyme [Streptomyces europaeiscabiei]|uniref:DUF7134 domain-containing protein n=1 Tax=Streptomyces europaeiscabiei TaxID=146819 RepID=UPI002E160512|nr:thiamine pyrophosphate-dependent enzyme [Streptomyces europaeiscabiei]
MTEAAAEPGDAHPVRYRDRVRRRRATVRLTRYADLVSGRVARLVRAARCWGLRLPPMMWDSLLPALLLLNITTMRAPQELPVAVALTAALALPRVWRRRAPLTVFGAVAAAAFVQLLMDVRLPAGIALLVALYTVALYTVALYTVALYTVALYMVAATSGRRGTLVAGAIVEGGALLACLRWATEGAFLTPFVAVTAMVVAAAVPGVNVRTTRSYLAALGERAARLEQQQDQQARLAVADPRPPVLAVSGDGGALYSITELATARQYDLNVTWPIVDDGGYGIRHEYMTDAFGEATGTELSRPGYVTLAESFGGTGGAHEPRHPRGGPGQGPSPRPSPSVVVLPAVLRMFAPTHVAG